MCFEKGWWNERGGDWRWDWQDSCSSKQIAFLTFLRVGKISTSQPNSLVFCISIMSDCINCFVIHCNWITRGAQSSFHVKMIYRLKTVVFASILIASKKWMSLHNNSCYSTLVHGNIKSPSVSYEKEWWATKTNLATHNILHVVILQSTISNHAMPHEVSREQYILGFMLREQHQLPAWCRSDMGLNIFLGTAAESVKSRRDGRKCNCDVP